MVNIVLASVAADGTQGNRDSTIGPPLASVSADGTKVAFDGSASNLVAGDTNDSSDVFVKDLTTGTVTLVSSGVFRPGLPPDSGAASISGDGTKVAFLSFDEKLVAGDTNNRPDVFVRDLTTGALTLVSSGASGQGNSRSDSPSISADGTKVAFISAASNLVAGDTNGSQDVFVKDLTTGAVTLVSSGVSGQGNVESYNPSISADGSKVAFYSAASNLVAGDTNGTDDVFVKDLTTGALTLVSSGVSGQGNSRSYNPSISADGTKIAFESSASNLAADDTNGFVDVFVKDLTTGAVTLVSSGAMGQGNDSSGGPSISADGTKVAFISFASNFVAGDTHGPDVFVKDLTTGFLTLVSSGAMGQGTDGSLGASISGNGAKVAFYSAASNLVAGDTNGRFDVFVATLAVPNQAPTDIALTTATVNEYAANGSGVGTLVTTDPDGGDAFTYTLLNDAGGRFAIGGAQNDQIVVADYLGLDFEQSQSHTIRVRATDSGGLSVVQNLVVTINDVNPESVTGDGRANKIVGGASADIFDGGAAADMLIGGDGNDNLYGGSGDDRLDGGDGNDVLNGSGGRDRLTGGDGSDTYVVDALDTIIENGATGTDTVQSAVINIDASTGDYAGVENFRIIGALALNATGDAEANTITGNGAANELNGDAGEDRLLGGGGDDRLAGGIGRDLLTGGAGGDTFVFKTASDSSTSQYDRIVDFGAGDMLDFTAIDADGDAMNGPTAFAVDALGDASFAQGHIRQTVRGDILQLDINLDGDAAPEMRILLLGRAGTPITQGDLVV